MGERKIQRCTVTYYDEGLSPDTVLVGGWEIVLAERKFGVAAEHPVEFSMYLGFLGAKRAGLVPDGVGFDAWGAGVALVEDAEPDEDGGSGESPAPPGT